jgi:PAS domain S-box-containing protein
MAIKSSVLIVDDDPKLRKTLSDILTAKGYTPIAAATGKAALEKVKEQLPDVALIDLRLEDIPGLEVMREIKEHSPGTECIVLTGYASQVSAIEAVNLGAYGYVQKPYDMELLLLTIQRAIEKREAEQALRESEERYRDLYDNAPVMYHTIDTKGIVLECNQTEVDMLGYSKEEIIGKPIYAFESKEYQDLAPHALREGMEKGHVVEERRFVKKDGTIIDAALEGMAIYDDSGQAVGFRATLTDITHFKRVEEALRESEEKYKILVENSLTGVQIHQDGKFVFVNDRFAEMHGYKHEELIGKDHLSLFHPDHRELVEQRASQRLKGEAVPQCYEAQKLRKDGEVIWCEIMVTRIQYRGRPAIMGNTIDISERKRAEEERKKLEAQLQRAQKMEAIGTLAGGVAHDLNNILAGLVSYPELLLLEIPEDSPLRKPILTIQKSGEKAATIVQDLLTLARRGVSAMEVVNLNHIISEYLKSPEHERLISFHAGVHVKTNLEKDLLNILGSPAHLSKTIMNLVSNAAEAMPDGGEIYISTENRYIDQPIRAYDHVEEGDYVALRVSDTGVGISKKDRERIFEPFYTKKVMGRSGTGLGMTVVWGAVKDHKGYIDIESAKGKGTTFTLYFPVSRKELPKDKSLLSIEDYMAKGESVLVVDDVEEQREIASRILKKLGYSVTSVSSGEEAVNYLKDNSADLLVLDMIMDPGIDGLKTYKRILEFHPKQKAIIVSGFSETKRVKEAQRLGAGAYVKKPFLLQRIGLAVRDELGR